MEIERVNLLSVEQDSRPRLAYSHTCQNLKSSPFLQICNGREIWNIIFRDNEEVLKFLAELEKAIHDQSAIMFPLEIGWK